MFLLLRFFVGVQLTAMSKKLPPKERKKSRTELQLKFQLVIRHGILEIKFKKHISTVLQIHKFFLKCILYKIVELNKNKSIVYMIFYIPS